MVIEELGLSPENVKRIHSGGDRGWKADVPVVRLSASKISKFGWVPLHNSREAIKKSIAEMYSELTR